MPYFFKGFVLESIHSPARASASPKGDRGNKSVFGQRDMNLTT
ncbi:hypothetical protein AOR13_3898 [Alteromonas stellipolaris LMG 21856]|nr:hypothetical protein AOR13_3898 [Alteromonas stellipolaris LMG 21856]